MNFYKTPLIIIASIFLLAATVTAAMKYETRLLFNERVEIMIPKGFFPIEQDFIRTANPFVEMDRIAYSDQSNSVQVTFGLTKMNHLNTDLSNTEALTMRYKELYPKAEFKGSGIKDIKGKNVTYLEMIKPDEEGNMRFNLLFFTEVNGELLFSCYTCPLNDYSNLAPQARRIMQSVKAR